MPQVPISKLAPEVRSLDDLFSIGHVFATGVTGSGKTTLVTTTTRDVSFPSLTLAFNYEDEPMPCDVQIKDPIELTDVIADSEGGHLSVEFVPSTGTAECLAELRSLQEQLFDLADALRAGRSKLDPWCLVVIPEVQKVAPKKRDEGPANDLMRRGRKRGIRVLCDSQRPATVSHDVLTQCRYHAIFELSGYEGPYFKDYGFDFEEITDWTESRPHRFVLARGTKWAPFEPLTGVFQAG